MSLDSESGFREEAIRENAATQAVEQVEARYGDYVARANTEEQALNKLVRTVELIG